MSKISPDNTEIDGGIEVVDLAWTWEKVDPDLEIGAIYLFSINGEGEENDGMLVTLPQAENNEDKRPPMTIFIWGSKAVVADATSHFRSISFGLIFIFPASIFSSALRHKSMYLSRC